MKLHKLSLLIFCFAACKPTIEPQNVTANPENPAKGFSLAVQDVTPFILADGNLEASIYLDKNSVGVKEAALSILSIAPNASVPLHVHPDAAEILWVLEGEGVLTFSSESKSVQTGDTLLLPPGVPHAFTAGDSQVKVVQFYTPGGAEQRFRGVESDGTIPAEKSPIADPGTARVVSFAEVPVSKNPEKPTVRTLLQNEKIAGNAISLLHVTLPASSPLDTHPHDGVSELIYFIRGKGFTQIDGVEYPIREGGAYYTPEGSNMGLSTETESEILVLVVKQSD